MTQAHIFYSGTVQGIGFRYNVVRFAEPLDLKGWVKNLDDGRVEILVEGEPSQIDQMIFLIDEKFDGYIRKKDVAYGPETGTLGDFEITY